MQRHLGQASITLAAGALLLGVLLALVDLFALDVFAVMFVPFVVLAVVRMRPLLHWVVFAGSVAASAFTLIGIERSDSSTAGLGVIFVLLLLVASIVLVALIERVATSRARPRERQT
ncbi:MAG: hypothetical protein ACREXY_16210 [Gammaproteobacteria bacterium]